MVIVQVLKLCCVAPLYDMINHGENKFFMGRSQFVVDGVSV
jgi:hypothetical protein